MFPFTINYTRCLGRKLSNIEIVDALNQIKVILEDKTAEDIKIVDSQLTFNAGFFGFRWNWNIMVPIDGGKIILKSTDTETVLVYTIFMHRLFIVTAVMSVFMGLASRQIGVGLFCFAWLCGANWVTGVLRHRGLIKGIAKKIQANRLKKTETEI